MINTEAWQALPPRKKKRGTGGTGQEPGVEEETNQQGVKEAEIGRIVTARSNTSTAQATLEGKDGCAGEFYEYLDHTADVQCHTWGATLEAALEAMAPCMFNYMTDLSLVTEDAASTVEFSVAGHDLHTLLFAYMDEMLFRFCTDQLCITRVEVLSLDRSAFSLTCRAHGAAFDRSKHTQGTEIKAITYSNMQVVEKEDRTDVFVIVDI